MTDFYSQKTKMFQTLEQTIQTATKRFLDDNTKGLLNEESLFIEINRQTGFSHIIKRHINHLILSGHVERTYSEDGKSLLKWVGA